MYDYPVLFPQASNRETWLQTVQICDDDTGDPITLTDTNNNPLYQLYLEIRQPRRWGGDQADNYGYAFSYYDSSGEPIIQASLADYISIVDVGLIQIKIPFTVMQTLRGTRTYDVYLRLEDSANSDARQLLIGRLPLAFGGWGP